MKRDSTSEGDEWIDVVAVDISGRHEVEGRYYMVCAAASARISPECIEKVHAVRLVPEVADGPDLGTVVDLISKATLPFRGTIIAERGDMYNMDAWRVKSILGRDFKYPESLGERIAVEMAHHISLAGRRLLKDDG